MKTKKFALGEQCIWLKILLFVFFSEAATAQTLTVQPNPYKFNYLTVDNGLSHTDAIDIAQDNKGYIWIATYFGLDRFDGYSTKKFYDDNIPADNAFKNRIISIYPDESGNIWLGSEGGLQCFDTKTEKYTDFDDAGKTAIPTFKKIIKRPGQELFGFTGNELKCYLIIGNQIKEKPLNLPKGLRISDMAAGPQGTLYLSSDEGLWIMDGNLTFSPVLIAHLTEQHFSNVYFDGQNNIVLAANNQAYLIFKNNQNWIFAGDQYSCSDGNTVQSIARHNNADYWIATSRSIFRLDKRFHVIQKIDDKSSLYRLNSTPLTKVFIDRSECLWVCTFGGGVNFCDLNQKLFYTLQHDPGDANSLSGNHIRSVLSDGDDLWIGTTENGLNRYNLKTQVYSYYNTYNSNIRLKNDAVTALAFDTDHNLWIGSNAGIEILKADGTGLWHPPGYEQFPDFGIRTFGKDCYGNMWFGNLMDKFGVIWKDKNNYFHVRYYGQGYYILPDKKIPQIFVSSTHGLKRIIVDEQGNISNTYNYTASSLHNPLSSNYVVPLCRQDSSTYWVGTIGGGLDRLELGKDDAYTVKFYASNYGVFNDVESLGIDNAGHIWMGGNGLERLNPLTGELIRYDKNDGLQGNSFKVGAFDKGVDGRMYFGGINGLNYFYPDQIKSNTIPARPVLTDILINNSKPNIGNSDSSLNHIATATGYGHDLELDYQQNNFILFFSAMHFANPLKCKYRYKLEGFDKDWKFTDGKNPSAAYSNLNYKSYHFIVQATNNDGLWSKDAAETMITIVPPWWKSDFANVIYVLLFVSGLLAIYIFQARLYRLKGEIEVRTINDKKREEMHKHQEELHKRQEEMYQQQLLFFTNVSHEFRTPLTLILGPLENLIGQNKNPKLDYSYQLMFRNAKRLVNLISELMNFRKVADSIVKLQVRPLVINSFYKDIGLEFRDSAIDKGIRFSMKDYTEIEKPWPLTGHFDVQILEKILFNLLNNALKYTDAGGEISFELFIDPERLRPSFNAGFQLLNENWRAKKYIYFRIADSGIGISSDSIAMIFDRYYRISNNHLGSGVGLALVKSLTLLHKGDIYVYSERNKGTEIIIAIPWGEENYLEAEKVVLGAGMRTQLEPIDKTISLPLPDQEKSSLVRRTNKRKNILLVDDNLELRILLKQAFEKSYNIYEAEDGLSGLKATAKHSPDLIISDIMMPGMDGIEFCKIIKEKPETRHIPFIVLSAKDDLDTKLESTGYGADFYFAKPLSIDLLVITVRNIFRQSEKLKLYHANGPDPVRSAQDEGFSLKLLKLIDDNIASQDLNWDFISKQLAISHNKLYQKIKNTSGQTITEFITTRRLNKALQMMNNEDMDVNDIASKTGFQGSSSFSNAFKREFGKSPSEYKKSMAKKI